MPRLPTVLILTASSILVGACAITRLAPGADQVRVTGAAADMAACKAVGNVQVPKNAQGLVDMASAQSQFRNQVVGLGGNAGLVTDGLVKFPSAGIAYRCP